MLDYVRLVKYSLSFVCCYSDGTASNANKPTVVNVEVENKFKTLRNMHKLNLRTWALKLIKESSTRISNAECQDWSSSLWGCRIKQKDIKYWEELPEEIFVTGVVYRILKQRARGQWHIYGLTDKQFYERMLEKGFNKKQSKEMLKMFKEDRIKTKAKV